MKSETIYNVQARKIRVPGKLIDLLRSELPLAEKREKLDQIIIRLKKTDSYDHPTLEILDKENMINDDIFDNSGTVYTL